MPNSLSQKKILILGGGPTGLMSAWELARNGVPVVLLEKEATCGGLGRTASIEGKGGTYRFDYGGHRFITHNRELLKLVERLLGDDLLVAHRKSAIRFKGRTYQYPLSLGNLLRTAPPSLLTGAAWDLTRLKSSAQDSTSFASWMTGRFGPTLYQHFFEGYTQKLWGIPPAQLSSDWAAQRISLIDLKDVFRRLIRLGKDTPRTYSTIYRYPRYGFGQIFDRLRAEAISFGAKILSEQEVKALNIQNGKITEVLTKDSSFPTDHVISTLSLPDMVRLCKGESHLRFRSLRFLNISLNLENISPYTWQYLSDPEILATRLQEPRRRSPKMAPPQKTSMMLEIPCYQGDSIWNASNEMLFERACEDMGRLGISLRPMAQSIFSTYAAHAYNIMDLDYRDEREKAKAHLNQIQNLTMCGRLGTFRYIFTDTAMEMGQMAAQSLLSEQNRQEEIYSHRNEKTVIEAQSVA